MKHITFALFTSIQLIIAGVVHRIIFRMFGIQVDDALFFWGGFVAIYFVLTLVSSLVFRNLSSNKSNYKA
ncbi:bacteriocin-like WGxF protein [Bacillus haynesii]|nr:bacteriocin-like WGxF protein [Bacillus haynesii]